MAETVPCDTALYVSYLEEVAASTKEIEVLTNAFGPSGFEDGAIREIKNWYGGLGVTDNAMYSVYATVKKKKAGRPVLVLDTHLDEYGFMVQSMLENEFLSILMLGGFHPTSPPAHSVIVRTRSGKEHRGIITSKPVRFLTATQKNDNSLAVEDILVDVGVSNQEGVTEVYGIHPGDPIMPGVSFEYHRENGILYGKTFDNRLGCVSITDTMQVLRDEADQLAVEVIGIFVVRGEVGTRGATAMTQQAQPDLAITFEGSLVDDFYFRVDIVQGCLRSDVQTRRTNSSYISNVELIRSVQETGSKLRIKYRDAVYRGGSTNAGKINLTGKAVLVLVLSIPSRYVHSHYNFCAEEDVDAIVRTVVEIIRGLDEERIARTLRKEIV